MSYEEQIVNGFVKCVKALHQNIKENKMIKVIVKDQPQNSIDICNVSPDVSIFVKKDKKLIGMIVFADDGWLIAKGSNFLCLKGQRFRSDYKGKIDCAIAAIEDGYELFIEENTMSKYECSECKYICTLEEMLNTAGKVETKYCCPNCWKPHRTLATWNEVKEDYDVSV